MAWSNVTATPPTGSQVTNFIISDSTMTPSMDGAHSYLFDGTYGGNPYFLREGVAFYQLSNPALKIPLAGDPAGDLEFTGGGGSSRPSTGMLYPRFS